MSDLSWLLRPHKVIIAQSIPIIQTFFSLQKFPKHPDPQSLTKSLHFASKQSRESHAFVSSSKNSGSPSHPTKSFPFYSKNPTFFQKYTNSPFLPYQFFPSWYVTGPTSSRSHPPPTRLPPTSSSVFKFVPRSHRASSGQYRLTILCSSRPHQEMSRED